MPTLKFSSPLFVTEISLALTLLKATLESGFLLDLILGSLDCHLLGAYGQSDLAQ